MNPITQLRGIEGGKKRASLVEIALGSIVLTAIALLSAFIIGFGFWLGVLAAQTVTP